MLAYKRALQAHTQATIKIYSVSPWALQHTDSSQTTSTTSVVFLNAPDSNSSFCLSFRFMCIRIWVHVCVCLFLSELKFLFYSFSSFFVFHLIFALRCTYISQLVEQTMSKSLKLVCTSGYRLTSIYTIRIFGCIFLLLSIRYGIRFSDAHTNSHTLTHEIRSDQIWTIIWCLSIVRVWKMQIEYLMWAC